mmetsp:Transcript_9052/g.26678  ORF Transcript_9052/g.26678 Transcript_9052/m.26678 type:complete len:203 (-) Transcript_9052:158-766(-)
MQSRCCSWRSRMCRLCARAPPCATPESGAVLSAPPHAVPAAPPRATLTPALPPGPQVDNWQAARTPSRAHSLAASSRVSWSSHSLVCEPSAEPARLWAAEPPGSRRHAEPTVSIPRCTHWSTSPVPHTSPSASPTRAARGVRRAAFTTRRGAALAWLRLLPAGARMSTRSERKVECESAPERVHECPAERASLAELSSALPS